MSDENCIFCKIVSGQIPSTKIYETDNIYGFMDINPLSEGHCLFIPKKHADTHNRTDDASLAEILPAMKEVANALGITTYNILQNNGEIAHQEVFHTHFHLIPKPSMDKGLKMAWEPITDADQDKAADQINKELSK